LAASGAKRPFAWLDYDDVRLGYRPVHLHSTLERGAIDTFKAAHVWVAVARSESPCAVWP
jgi:hypothetical protein